MGTIYKASEELLRTETTSTIENHSLFKLLGKHNLQLHEVNRSENVELKIFNNAETFLRALEIFMKKKLVKLSTASFSFHYHECRLIHFVISTSLNTLELILDFFRNSSR